ncbi:MAG: hypothetical protein GY928_24405 [Colwellia sp.]|nr:hypothetical protein [Colwellia sp.]
MKVQSSKSINEVKGSYLMLLVCVNLICVGLLLLVLFSSKKEDAFVNLMIAASVTWLPCNVMFAILYLIVGNSKSLSTIKSLGAMGKRDRKNLIRAAALLCIPNALGIIVIIKGAALIGCGILFVSLFAYFYYQKKLLRKSRKTELENI